MERLQKKIAIFFFFLFNKIASYSLDLQNR